jgi:hypothetical protein
MFVRRKNDLEMELISLDIAVRAQVLDGPAARTLDIRKLVSRRESRRIDGLTQPNSMQVHDSRVNGETNKSDNSDKGHRDDDEALTGSRIPAALQ